MHTLHCADLDQLLFPMDLQQTVRVTRLQVRPHPALLACSTLVNLPISRRMHTAAVVSERMMGSAGSYDETEEEKVLPPPRLRHLQTSTSTLSDSSSMSSSTMSDSEYQPMQQEPRLMSQQDAIDNLFARQHVPKWTWQLALYAPFGAILACLRMALWVLGIIIDAPWFRNRRVIDGYLALLGFKTKWKNLHLLPKGHHVMVSNHTTPADLQVLYQLPQRYTHIIATAVPEQACATNNLPVSLRHAKADIYDRLAEEIAQAGPQAQPVHLFPEGGLTNGKGMMQFARGFMKFVAEGTPVVPVALRARFPFSIDTHTLTSSFFANLFWVNFFPWVEVEAVVLPPTTQREGEGRAAFVSRVQQQIADELNVPVADLTIQQKRQAMKQEVAKQQHKRR